VFAERTGAEAVEVGRHRNATVYGLHYRQNADDADTVSLRAAEGRLQSAFSLGNADSSDADHTPADCVYSQSNADADGDGWTDEQLQALIDSDGGAHMSASSIVRDQHRLSRVDVLEGRLSVRSVCALPYSDTTLLLNGATVTP
jgi:hypothetical protein